MPASSRCGFPVDGAAGIRPSGMFAAVRGQVPVGQTLVRHRSAHHPAEPGLTRCSGPPVPGQRAHPRLKSHVLRIHLIFRHVVHNHSVRNRNRSRRLDRHRPGPCRLQPPRTRISHCQHAPRGDRQRPRVVVRRALDRLPLMAQPASGVRERTTRSAPSTRTGFSRITRSMSPAFSRTSGKIGLIRTDRRRAAALAIAAWFLARSAVGKASKGGGGGGEVSIP